MRGLRGACAGAAMLALLAGCGKTATETAAPVDWPAFVQGFIDADFSRNPDFAVYQGRHEYDGQIPDWSEAGLAAEIAALREWKAKTEAVDPAGLTDAQTFERDYLIAQIDGQLFWLADADWPHRNPAFYNLDPNVYIARPYADVTTRMKAYTAFAENVPEAAAQIRANLKFPMPRSYIDTGVASFGGVADYMKSDVKLAFADADASAKGEFEEANAAAAAALDELVVWLEAQRATQTEDFALGPDLFAKMIYANERVDTPLAELEAIGRADLKRNQDALAEACASFAPGETIRLCVAKAAGSKPKGGVVEEARQQLVALKQFVVDNNVVSVPGTEEALVEEAPPYNRQNFAYIDIPGPYETGLPSVYYIAPPDASWPADKQLGYIPGKAILLFTSVHEVWPGHFLNFLHANRAGSIFGKVYVGYAYAEGWAHYTEEMMWEKGFGAGDPETHIGQLLNALLRDARFISAIGLHTQGMTVAESEALFLNEAYQDPGNAEQQAARGTYDPAYLNYTMGKLMIRKLRDDWSESRGGQEAWKDFHDAFLSYGGPPIPLVRGAMMGTPAEAAF